AGTGARTSAAAVWRTAARALGVVDHLAERVHRIDDLALRRAIGPGLRLALVVARAGAHLLRARARSRSDAIAIAGPRTAAAGLRGAHAGARRIDQVTGTCRVVAAHGALAGLNHAVRVVVDRRNDRLVDRAERRIAGADRGAGRCEADDLVGERRD